MTKKQQPTTAKSVPPPEPNPDTFKQMQKLQRKFTKLSRQMQQLQSSLSKPTGQPLSQGILGPPSSQEDDDSSSSSASSSSRSSPDSESESGESETDLTTPLTPSMGECPSDEDDVQSLVSPALSGNTVALNVPPMSKANGCINGRTSKSKSSKKDKAKEKDPKEKKNRKKQQQMMPSNGIPSQQLTMFTVRRDSTSADGDDKKSKVRASKREFKRLDELYNKNIHDFYLAEASQVQLSKDDQWEEYVFVVRRRFDWQNKYQKTYIDIKSIELRGILRELMKDVSGIGLREEKPTVEPNILFNYLSELETQLEKARSAPSAEKNENLISHLALLVDYINSDYAATARRLYPLLEHDEITFDLLWALFLPNTLVYTVCAGSNEPRCLKLDWGEQKETLERGRFFQLDCHYVDYDGKNFGKASAVLEIDEFRGSRRIDSLGVFPLAYHEDEETMRENLIQRGRKFGSLKGMHYKCYKGLAFFKRKRGVIRVNVNGRIMVDPSTFRKINPNYRTSPIRETPNNSSTAQTNEDDTDNDGGDEDDDECGGCGGDEDDEGEINSSVSNEVKTKTKSISTIKTNIAKKQQRTYILDADGKIKLVGATGTVAASAAKKKLLAKDGDTGKDSMVPEEMTEEELLLCSPTVLGFSFSDKLWVEFAVEHVGEINFNPNAFESLVLPEAQKTIVRALVESHTVSKEGKGGFDDVIKGKGKGLVAVLHGRPGVGKTLTAEGISEFLKRPLYMVGAGELGTDSRTLETQLSRILDIAHIWGAVLLLDEADVFLERRSVHDLQRNALVSIFLRLLEYFQGILFLTTNRVETFDEAFQSRIHIALRYNDLDRKAKRIIWRTFLGMVARDEEGSVGINGGEGREVVTKDELENLAKRQLNGRQIKNAVRTAQALADNKNEKLSMKHLSVVLAVTEGFEHDLKGTGQIETMHKVHVRRFSSKAVFHFAFHGEVSDCVPRFDSIPTDPKLGNATVPKDYTALDFSQHFSVINVETAPNMPTANENSALSKPNALIVSRYNPSDPNDRRPASFSGKGGTAFDLFGFWVQPSAAPPPGTTLFVKAISKDGKLFEWSKYFPDDTTEPHYFDPYNEAGPELWDGIVKVEVWAEYTEGDDWEFFIDDMWVRWGDVEPAIAHEL
ncbi:hypothetical protein RUND412_001577 [Rhizina undulata]